MSKRADHLMEAWNYEKAQVGREEIFARVKEQGEHLRLQIGDREIPLAFAPELLSNTPGHDGRFEDTHRNSHYRGRQRILEKIGDAFRQENFALLHAALDEYEKFFVDAYRIFLEDTQLAHCEHGERRDRCDRCQAADYEKTVQRAGGRPNW